MDLLTNLAAGSRFAEWTSTSLFTPAVKRARAFTALTYAQGRRRYRGSSQGFCMLDEPNAILRIHFVRIDKRQSDISFELFDLIRQRIVFYAKQNIDNADIGMQDIAKEHDAFDSSFFDVKATAEGRLMF